MPYGSRRVSTDAQQTALQRAALKQAGCITIVTDEGLAGATVQRPALTRCLAARRPWWSHLRCVRDAPPQRCASTGEGNTCRVQRVRSPVQGQNPPQDWRSSCRRATIASPSRPQGSPTGTAWAPLACSKEIVMRGCMVPRSTRRCQPHFHLPPRLLWDARAIIGPAWRRGPFVQVVPQSRAPMELLWQKPFSLTYILSSQPVSDPGIHREPAWLR
jgi:resolvase-like protein